MAKAIKLYWAVLLIVALGGCGGGDNGPTVSGVVAAGSPISGIVYLKDSSVPSKEVSLPIAADGSFSFNLKGLTAPFLLKAVGNSSGFLGTLYSFSTGPGVANVNPLSNLAVALAYGSGDLEALYGSAAPAKITAIATALPNAIADVQTALQPALAKTGAATINFVTDRFVANHQGLDQFFDLTRINVDTNGVTITDILANTDANGWIHYNNPIGLDTFRTSSIDLTTDPKTTVGTVAVKPTDIVVAPNASFKFQTMIMGSQNQQLDWSVAGDNGGTITNSGVYTAPATPGSYQITATNRSDPTKSTIIHVKVSSENILTVVSSGPGSYQVLANNFTNVAGLDFTMTYDAASLTDPQLTEGTLTTGVMSQENISIPGVVRWVFVSSKAIAGSGVLATINLNEIGPSPGRILSISSRMVDSNGRTSGTVSLVGTPALSLQTSTL